MVALGASFVARGHISRVDRNRSPDHPRAPACHASSFPDRPRGPAGAARASGPGRPAPAAHAGRLRPRRAHARPEHEPARERHRRPAHLAGRRPLLVPRQHAGGQPVPAGEPGAQDAASRRSTMPRLAAALSAAQRADAWTATSSRSRRIDLSADATRVTVRRAAARAELRPVGIHLRQGAGRARPAQRAAQLQRVARRHAGPCSSATTTSGRSTWPPAPSRSSPPTASRTSATPPTTPAGCTTTIRWSPGRPTAAQIATFQHDGRGVRDMYLVSTNVGSPNAAGVEVSAAGRQRDLPRRAG